MPFMKTINNIMIIMVVAVLSASAETQGQIVGARESLNGQKFSGTNQKAERRRPFGTGLVRHCPQGLFSSFFTFLRAIFSRPFRLSHAPTICPWVSKDVLSVMVVMMTMMIIMKMMTTIMMTMMVMMNDDDDDDDWLVSW